MTQPASQPPSPGLAVQRCCQAFSAASEAETAKGSGLYAVSLKASAAFRNAMPYLAGEDNVREFIACTAHGILLGVIEPIDGAKLLYAAQVAMSCLRHQSNPGRSSQKETPTPASQ